MYAHKNSGTKPKILFSTVFSLPVVLAIQSPAPVLAVVAHPKTLVSFNTLISIEFQAPGDATPPDTTGGGTRGTVRFQAPGEPTPYDTTGGGTRGDIIFAAPGDNAPTNTTGGGTRGDVQFQSAGDASPSDTTGGGTRGDVQFQSAGDASPSDTTGGGTRDVRFAPSGDPTPTPTTGGGTRDVRFEAPNDASPSTTQGGGTRNEPLSVFVPLIPKTRYGHTIAGRPTFFVYVPQTTRKQIFFSLQNADRTHHYQTTFEISGKQGIVSFTLPDNAPELEIGKDYLWFFAVVEPGQTLRPDNYGVTGWVKRVPPPATAPQNAQLTPIKQATLYAQAGIWYDTLALLASAKQAQPDNATLASEWQELLQQVELEYLAPLPFAEQL